MISQNKGMKECVEDDKAGQHWGRDGDIALLIQAFIFCLRNPTNRRCPRVLRPAVSGR